YSVPAIIAINKIDLLTGEDDIELKEAVSYLYRSIGYKVFALSAKTGEGLTTLKDELVGKVTLFSGNSGVGKSSLINDLIPGLDLKTAAISAAHGTGMHTTTFSEMFHLPEGGSIIDTPGVRGFGTVDFERNEVAHYFPEIFEKSGECRFNNCTHTCEPGCAVLRAVEDAEIAASRYASYLSILEDADESKYREGYK
ncbi:MAG: ribosome small subunit-dependent GTPase A, partial [Muribaculaceae bacterium]|nr:ribosome small subunit-dependent GTPase A [Muribaculaceae bacterium]